MGNFEHLNAILGCSIFSTAPAHSRLAVHSAFIIIIISWFLPVGIEKSLPLIRLSLRSVSFEATTSLSKLIQTHIIKVHLQPTTRSISFDATASLSKLIQSYTSKVHLQPTMRTFLSSFKPIPARSIYNQRCDCEPF